MTPLLKAVSIIHFIMESLSPFSNQKVGQCQLEVDPLSLKVACQAWMTMAIKARYLVMRRGLPRFNILLHIMAEATERRALRIPKHRP
jgi:hypothetical protein